MIEAHCDKLEVIEGVLFDDCDKLQPVKDELFLQYMETKDPAILELWFKAQTVFNLWMQAQHQLRITAIARDNPTKGKPAK